MQNQSFFRLIFASSAQLEMLDTEQLFTYLLTCVETNITYYFAIFLDKIHKLLKSKKKSINYKVIMSLTNLGVSAKIW